MSMKKRLVRYAPLALAALVIGIAVLVYRGPGRPFIRGHVGDVAATMIVYATLGWLLWDKLARWELRAFGAMAIATAIELGQKVWTGTGRAGEIFVGSYFDGWDFAAYALGTVIAVAYDFMRPWPGELPLVARTGAASSPPTASS